MKKNINCFKVKTPKEIFKILKNDEINEENDIYTYYKSAIIHLDKNFEKVFLFYFICIKISL